MRLQDKDGNFGERKCTNNNNKRNQIGPLQKLLNKAKHKRQLRNLSHV